MSTQLTNTSALILSDQSFDRIMRMAEMMASGRATVPAHLQGNPGDCMAVIIQAMQWGMSPFAVGQKTHLVNGALGYEAQLVNAVVQASGAIKGRFHYEYRGEGPALSCRVGAIITGESYITWGQWLCAASITTKNSPLWKVNPHQQLGYLQVKNWSRAYTPGAILGVYTPDELDELPAPPRNMGNAEEVVAEDDPWTEELVMAAGQAAQAGGKAYMKFWKSLDAGLRKTLVDTVNHAAFKQQASDADFKQSVHDADFKQSVHDAAEKPSIDADTGEINLSAAEVRGFIANANTEDALYLAMQWLETVPQPEREQVRPGLEVLFDRQLAMIRGDAP